MGVSITAVILGAGANSRLKEIVPPGLKPLLLVNGRPLIQHAIDHAVNTWKAERVVIVVGPENAGPITAVVDHRHDFVLQPRPYGVVNAISRALPFVKTRHTLILCADNTFEGEAPQKITLLDQFIAVNTSVRDTQERFTHLRELTIDASSHSEGTRVLSTGRCEVVEYGHEYSTVWIGPLLLSTSRLIEKMGQHEVPAGIFGLLSSVGPFTMWAMNCSDLGIPEALWESTTS